MFEYGSRTWGTPGRMVRLSYAIDMRYGVLYDVASAVFAGRPLDLTMGHADVIWQGDANEQALRLLAHCTTPATPINVTGPRHTSVRWLAAEFGKRFGKTPVLTGQEAPTAWLEDTTQAQALFGEPRVPLADHDRLGGRLGGSAAGRAWASRPISRREMASTEPDKEPRLRGDPRLRRHDPSAVRAEPARRYSSGR